MRECINIRQGSRLTLLRRMQSSWRAGLRNGARLLHGERVACDRELLTHGIQAEIIYRGIGNESRAPYIE